MHSEKPLRVRNRKQMFIDKRFVHSGRGVSLRMNRPRLEDVAVEPGPPGSWDDMSITGYGRVMEDEGIYRMWVRCHSVDRMVKRIARDDPVPKANWLGYMESTDGIHWRKPELGLFEHAGSKDNNIAYVDAGYVFIDPNGPDVERYKLLVQGRYLYDTREGGKPDPDKGGFYILTSSDGIRWTWHGNRVLPFLADTINQLEWDGRIGKYVAYVRTWPNGFRDGHYRYGRAVGRVEIDDCMCPWPHEKMKSPFASSDPSERIVTISKEVPTVLEYPGYSEPGNWTDLYTAAVHQYTEAEDVYLAFPSFNNYFPDSDLLNHSVLDIGMAVSRDGIHWEWPSLDPYISRGEPGSGRSAALYMVYGVLKVDDAVYQYHNGSDIDHGVLSRVEPDRLYCASKIYRTVQRLDGFMSLDFQGSGGEITTPLLDFTGGELYLNVDASGGFGKVGIRDETGGFHPGYEVGACDGIQSDSVSHKVTWNGDSRIKGLRDRPVRLCFRMSGARLFSFQFQ